MIEQLLGGSQVAQTYFPLSGPGTKTLQKGTQALGYFGEVSGAELFLGSELINKFNLSVGAPLSWSGTQWFKFFRNGKVIYIARQQVANSICWNDLYNLGLVYGVKGNGLYPVGAGVDQFNPVMKNDGVRNWYLKPRLMTGMGVDPSGAGLTDGGEFNQLFGRIVTGANTGVAEKWATLATTYVSATGHLGSLVQETYQTDVTLAFTRGAMNDLTYVTIPGKAIQAYAWRPVLELIPDSVLLDPYAVVGVPVGLQAPAIVDVRTAQQGAGTAGLLNPVNVTTSWPTKQPVVTGATFTGSALSPLNVKSTTAPALNGFTISGVSDQLASGPANLVWNQADLNPFTISGAYAA